MHTWFDAQLDQKILNGIYAWTWPLKFTIIQKFPKEHEMFAN